jgi:hypothetical protein
MRRNRRRKIDFVPVAVVGAARHAVGAPWLTQGSSANPYVIAADADPWQAISPP